MLNRRDALFGLTLTFAGATVGLAYAAPALGWMPSALTPDQARTLDAMAELIVPATDSPGARDAGVPAFVDRTVGGYCEAAEAEMIRKGLARADADAKAAHGKAFADLAPAAQTALLTRYDQEAAATKGKPHFFGTLKTYVLIGYFTSQKGATIALRYDPVPGDYRGCVPLKEIGRAWAT